MALEEHAELVVKTKSGESYTIAESRIVKGSLTASSSCSSGGGIPAGACNIGTASVAFRAPSGLTYKKLYRAKVEIYAWYQGYSKELYGTYNVSSAENNYGVYTLSLSDNISLLDESCYAANDTENAENWLYSQMAGRWNVPSVILNYICNAYNVPHYNAAENEKYVPDSGNTALATGVSSECSVESVKDFANYLAEYLGCFIAAAPDGRVRFSRLGEREYKTELNQSNISRGTLQRSPYYVHPSVWKVSFDSGYGSSWYVSSDLPDDAAPLSINITNNPFWQVQEDRVPADIYGGKVTQMIKYMWDYLYNAAIKKDGNTVEYMINPFSCTVHVPYHFRIGDIVTVRDYVNGDVFRSYLTDITWTFRGGQQISCAGDDTRTLSVGTSRSAAKKSNDYSKYLYRKSKTGSSGGDANTYTKAEIDAKDASVRSAADKAQETADSAVDVNNTQNTQISALQKSEHAHSNKDVLDKTEQPYTTAERDKLAGLENYTHPTHTAYSRGLYNITVDSEGHIISATAITKGDITSLGIPGANTTYTFHRDESLNWAESQCNKLQITKHESGVDTQLESIKLIPTVRVSDGFETSGIVYFLTVDSKYCKKDNRNETMWNGDTYDAKTWIRLNTKYSGPVGYKSSAALESEVAIVAPEFIGANATNQKQGLMSPEDKKKLDEMDLSKYLPLSGGVMTGDIDMQTNKKDILIGTQKANTSYGTAVAGGCIDKAAQMTSTIPGMRSFIGSFQNTNNGKYYNLISVRHRNGYSDGNAYGMYIFSELTSASGNLKWGKQTASGTWTDDFVLLDSRNYTDYALEKNGTAVKANALSSGLMKFGWVHNSNTTASSGYTWARVCYCESNIGYHTITMTLLATSGFAGAGLFSVYFRNSSTGKSCDNIGLEQVFTNKPSKIAKDYLKFVAVYTGSSVRYEIWCNTQAIWSSFQFVCLGEQAYAGGSTNGWIFENHDATTFKTAPTTGDKEAAYYNNGVVSTANSANSAKILETARTLTVGNTGKSFNGSANMSWSLDEIGVIGRTTAGKTYTFNNKSLTGDASSVLFNDYSSNQAGGGTYQSVFGNQCKAFNGNTIFVTGWKNTVQGHQASGFGENNNINGEASSSFGNGNTVTGTTDIAFGDGNTVTGTANMATGYGNTVAGNRNFATGEGNTIGASCTGGATIGNYNTCNNNASLSGGWYSYVDANQAIAYGNHCRTSYQSSASFGAYNSYDKVGVQLTLGNGTESARANAFRAAAGGVYSSGAYHTSGADYAEYFEWLDGNPDNEDRRGRFAKLDGEKILLAESIDDDILGVVSAHPSVTGDSYEDNWQGQYKTDIFGELLTEDYTDDDGTTRKVWALNPDYNPEKIYVPRSERKEWNAVGMMGKLIVIDDGTCRPNDYCVPTTGGIATRSEGRVGYRVLSRIDDTHIKVLIKG